MTPRAPAVLWALALIVASCGSGRPATLPADVQVTVDMREYSVTVTPPTIAAGTVKFGVRNLGATAHDFDLIRTDLAGDKLPVDNAKAKEDVLVKQFLNIQPGTVATITADLRPGHYVIICNVAGHYQLGMRAELQAE